MSEVDFFIEIDRLEEDVNRWLRNISPIVVRGNDGIGTNAYFKCVFEALKIMLEKMRVLNQNILSLKKDALIHRIQKCPDVEKFYKDEDK